MVKREGGVQPTGECLTVLESQMAQLLADNRQFREGQVKANTYHRHINQKLDWLMMDTARVVDSDEEEEGIEREETKDGEEEEQEQEKDQGGEEEEEEEEELAPKKARSVKGKERAVE
ncbi:hypothetical protein EV359DRAFT_85465 [Lentinula novae-zelandiae]|nr:hypothetical protein EV359DRAFT_85465 [Lentinula novae-zelandiae]